MLHETFEKIVMEKLLNGDYKIQTMLRLQYINSTIISREYTGRGFFTTFFVPDYLIVLNANGRIDDVIARFSNSEVYYFILYIINGKIDTLEGFSTLYEWKCNYEEAEITYCFQNKRDYNLVYEEKIT